MSPILKRDISEQIRQARRLATATLSSKHSHDDRQQLFDNVKHEGREDDQSRGSSKLGSLSYTSSSSPRKGIGVEEEEEERPTSAWDWTDDVRDASQGKGMKGKEKASVNEMEHEEDEEEEEQVRTGPIFVMKEPDGGDVRIGEDERMLEVDTEQEGEEIRMSRVTSLTGPRGTMGTMEIDDAMGMGKRCGRLKDLRNLILESTPSLMLSLVGLVFTGELLEHLARWTVFRRVDELFILFPMIGNLKGNLEMCLSARLGTSANMGEIDHRGTRRALLIANMTLLALQALIISSIAAFLSFVLGLMTTHRLGDNPTGLDNTVTPSDADAGLAVGEVEWHEGYTRPGWKQLVMMLATGMGAAGLSSAVLGSFMSYLVVMSRWANIDPDNITPPLAACLGDLLTLFILALLGTVLVGAMDTPLPLMAVIMMTIAAGWFSRRVLRNRWVKEVATGGWIPLIGAMLISSGTGMVLDRGVGKYRGFALLATSMTGLTGSFGAIHANRLSTKLHTALQSRSTSHSSGSSRSSLTGLSPLESLLTLLGLAFPFKACFLLFVTWAGWIDLSLGWAGWATYALTAGTSLVLAHYLTLFFWSKDLDPDSYTLPIHSALVDLIGQSLLMLAYEICIWQGKDVTIPNDSSR